MPRGLPDYYNPDTLVSQRLANVEEIVTHQRGIASLDNRGRTLYFMPFNSTLNGWKLLAVGDAVAPAISTDTALLEASSMKMDAGTLSGGGKSRALKNFVISDIAQAGLEISIGWENQLGEFWITFEYDSGVGEAESTYKIDGPNSVIQLYTSGALTTVYTLPTYDDTINWLVLKMVADFAGGNYSRLLVGLDQVDVSAYPLIPSGTSYAGKLYTNFLHTAVDDGTNLAYIGHVAITVDEP